MSKRLRIARISAQNGPVTFFGFGELAFFE
jgi:hypothetical protein